MDKNWLLIFVLAALGGACGDSGNNDTAADQSKLKRDARARLSSGSVASSSDPCANNSWYEDGECDAWCPEGDSSDCTDGDGPIVCALFFTEADGKCDRDDPCGPVQDADCQTSGGGSDGSEPVVCTAIHFETNGKCEAAKGCERSDPDDCAGDLACPEIWSPADGVCDRTDPCGTATDEDCAGQSEPGDPGTGIACIEIAYATNGQCEAAPGCEYTDPEDCSDDGDGLVCPAVYREKDGKCPPDDACDPDC